MFANIKFDLTAQKALELSLEKEKDMEKERLHHVLKAHCSRFWETVQMKQENYSIINVKDELIKAGVSFKENTDQTYDCDLTRAENDNRWFSKTVKQRDDDMNIIITSVTAYIEKAAKDQHRSCVWSPDGNHQDDYNWKWLIKLLEGNGFSACINQEGDIMINW